MSFNNNIKNKSFVQQFVVYKKINRTFIFKHLEEFTSALNFFDARYIVYCLQ